jgi:hypothetical protein
MDPGPINRSIRRTDLAGKRANKDVVSRHELMFEIWLIGDDAAAAGIDKHDWTVQGSTPSSSRVTLGCLLQLSKILAGKFGIDTGGLRCCAGNQCEQGYDQTRHFSARVPHDNAVSIISMREDLKQRKSSAVTFSCGCFSGWSFWDIHRLQGGCAGSVPDTSAFLFCIPVRYDSTSLTLASVAGAHRPQ